MRSRLAIATASLLAVAATVGGVWFVRHPKVAPVVCGEAIAPVTAQAVFDRLKAIKAPDGCALDAVDTHKDTMSIRFVHGASALPELAVFSKNCTSAPAVGTTFAYRIPAELVSACPTTMTAVAAAFRETDFGGTTLLASSSSPALLYRPQLSTPMKVELAGALVVAGFALWFARKRRAA